MFSFHEAAPLPRGLSYPHPFATHLAILRPRECVAMRVRFIRPAFTLIELLVVLAIICVLLSLLLPAVQKVRESASRAKCLNNLKLLGLALHNYHDVYRALPPGYFASGPHVNGTMDTSPGWAWGVYILPFLEQQNLYNQYNLSLPVQNSPATVTVLNTYLCPSDFTPSTAFAVTGSSWATICKAPPCSYAACCGGGVSTTAATGNGVFYRNSQTRLTDITDGTSHTLFIQERAFAKVQGTWVGAISGGYCNQGLYNPGAVPGKLGQGAADLVLVHAGTNNNPSGRNLDDASSMHTGGSNFLFADGSVHFIRNITSNSVDSLILQAMGTKAGGEVLTSDLLN
jgi:prepilin-type N-terminal cleavage/methylation domain-containing protein/prepilin-type processing-associated H-X9-DG protein